MEKSDPIWKGIYKDFSEVPVEGAGFDGDIWIQNSLRKMVSLREHVCLLPVIIVNIFCR